jgi:hypothetical protein
LQPRRFGGFGDASTASDRISIAPSASSTTTSAYSTPAPVAPSSATSTTFRNADPSLPTLSSQAAPQFIVGSYNATPFIPVTQSNVEISNSGELERKLIDEVCVSVGVNVQVPKQMLNAFLEKVKTLDEKMVVVSLVVKTGDENITARSKAYFIIYSLLFGENPSLAQVFIIYFMITEMNFIRPNPLFHHCLFLTLILFWIILME